MIIRRHFFGALGALGALHGLSLSRPLKACPYGTRQRLNWAIDVINMEPQAGQQRAAVVTDLSLQPGGDQLAIVGDDHFICVYDFTSPKLY